MLVLGRKLREKIIIADNIEITVVKIDRNCVRLGIVAPPHVLVVREGARSAVPRHLDKLPPEPEAAAG